MDILKYLQKEKNLSVDEISAAMNTTTSHINNIISQKELFDGQDLEEYLKSSGLRFWEFAVKAIPIDHLPEKAKDRVLLCKEIASHIKNKKKKL